MRSSALSTLVLAVALSGCAQETAAPEAAPVDAALGTPAEAPVQAMEAAATGDEIALTPQNTTIQFVGVHSDPAKPDPRTGQFTAFEGTAVVDGTSLKSVRVDIETGSLTTEIEKLTNHLKDTDFFSVREYPKATFVSTKIEEAGNGSATITGDLTLLGRTQSITFPATISTADGLSLKSEFTIDRTVFGMDYGVENVEKEVAMTISVGG